MTFALACALLMGFAIQRGGICMVAAIEEALGGGGSSRLLALLEAALWVGGGLTLLRMAGWSMLPAPQYAAGLSPIIGGALLGLGAYVNRGCAFGTIARLASGDLSYALMPVGFLIGARTGLTILGAMPSTSSTMQGAWLGMLLATVFVALATWRLGSSIGAARRRKLLAHIWAPQRATIVIGLASLALMCAAGAWTYTDYLVDLSRSGVPMAKTRLSLFLALFAGALVGGWIAARPALVRPTAAALGRSLAGGFVMGVGGRIVPGGNDGLILVGLPFLQRSAILALAVMAATIAAAILLDRLIRRSGRATEKRTDCKPPHTG